MLTTNSKKLYEYIQLLKNQGQHPDDPRYFHRVLGYNYRMTNIQAAIGIEQLKHLSEYIAKKRAIRKWYATYLKPLTSQGIITLQAPTKNASPSYWMNAFVSKVPATIVAKKLLLKGIDTRPFFVPMHHLPYVTNDKKKKYPVAEHLYKYGIMIPSGSNLLEKDIKYISQQIINQLHP